MKILGKTFLSYFLIAVFYSMPLLAGGVGGGGPPALADLSNEIMMAEPGKAGVFDNGAGDIGLLAKGELLPTLIVSKSSVQARSGSTGDLAVSDDDFSMLSLRSMPLDTIGINGEIASYRIEADVDKLILKDRRKLVRRAVGN